MTEYHTDGGCGGRIIRKGRTGGKPYCIGCRTVIEHRCHESEIKKESTLAFQKKALESSSSTLPRSKRKLLGGDAK